MVDLPHENILPTKISRITVDETSVEERNQKIGNGGIDEEEKKVVEDERKRKEDKKGKSKKYRRKKE